jgi:hypothetical membrane protein
MTFDKGKIAGALLFVGVVQVILFQVVCQTVYSGYSVGQQAISDLGNWRLAGNFAVVFNISAILLGLLIGTGTYFVWKELKNRPFVSLLALVGACNLGLGVFTEDISPPIHGLIYLIMSVSWAAAAILSYRLKKSLYSYVSICLGVFSFVVFILSLLGKYVDYSLIFGLGLGGIERLSVYPLWLWTLGFGAYLMGESSTGIQINKTESIQNGTK